MIPDVHRWNSSRKSNIICELGETNKGVKIARTIGQQNSDPGDEILHRETKWIKFSGAPTISSKLAHRNKIRD
jgi:hypothetical protein